MTRAKNTNNDRQADKLDESDSKSSEVRKVVLDIEPAKEIIALIADEDGKADEDLLDNALEALEGAGRRIPSDAQQRAAAGEAVALELTPEAAEAVETLIVRNTDVRPKLLRRVRERLQGKLKSARRKRGDGR